MSALALPSAFFLLLIGARSVDGFLQEHNRRTGSIWDGRTTEASGRAGRRCFLEALPVRSDETDPSSSNPAAGATDRRRALKATGMAVFSLWLGDTLGPDSIPSKWAASAAEEAASSEGASKTILITGCNSGIGLEAARILARRNPADRLVLACRTQAKAEGAARQILAESPSSNLVAAECDLASLDSIQKFAASLDKQPLDVVCYNAGIALNTKGEIERTTNGFEKTVGTNHLGHFYLHHLLQPKLNTSTAKVVVTASSVHDPESPGGKQGVPATLGDLVGFARDGKNFQMVDGNPYNGDKAYKDSKLCNILFCKELQRRLGSDEATKNIVPAASFGSPRHQNTGELHWHT
ncbi:unnamed protein product [Pseudo-nitzschia multistriata]|uniref:Uncharacterized protein n=1 Tax=Pseudo-nitzschia multistriata TaxID=183589 RepID=A0A448ZI82_9STRA|nr:unnamed protein product [Pseudo-nitzschia multistriata]